MLENISLNAILKYKKVLIFSKDEKVSDFLSLLAKAYENKRILFVSNYVFDANNIYHCDIFNAKLEKILKIACKKVFLKQIYPFDLIIIDNLAFVDKKIIALLNKINIHLICTSYERQNLFMLNAKIAHFYYQKNTIYLKSKECIFKYNLIEKNIKCKNIFKANKINFNLDDEVEFYLSCIKQGFKFRDFRAKRKYEFTKLISNYQINNFKHKTMFKKDFFDSKELFYNFYPKSKLLCKTKIYS